MIYPFPLNYFTNKTYKNTMQTLNPELIRVGLPGVVYRNIFLIQHREGILVWTRKTAKIKVVGSGW